MIYLSHFILVITISPKLMEVFVLIVILTRYTHTFTLLCVLIMRNASENKNKSWLCTVNALEHVYVEHYISVEFIIQQLQSLLQLKTVPSYKKPDLWISGG